MIMDILELAAMLEWLALGALTFFKLRSLNRRADRIMKECEEVAFTPNELREIYGKDPIQEDMKHLDADR